MLPVSGAEQLNTSEAQEMRPISSDSNAYSRLVNPAPQNSSSSCSDGGMNMFQRPSAFALAFNSSITGMNLPARSFRVLLVVDLHRRADVLVHEALNSLEPLPLPGRHREVHRTLLALWLGPAQ